MVIRSVPRTTGRAGPAAAAALTVALLACSGTAGGGGTGAAEAIEEADAAQQPEAIEEAGAVDDLGDDVADCVTHQGERRCRELHVPASMTDPAPLVIDLHGWTETAADQRRLSGFDALADEVGFIVAWPEGVETSWNAGAACCRPSNQSGVDDVGFVAAMVAAVTDAHPVDPDRVYLTGYDVDMTGIAWDFMSRFRRPTEPS